MIDLIEIYVHWYAGRSQVQIADSLGVDRKTVRKYLAPVAAAGMMPGGPPVMSEADWRDRARALMMLRPAGSLLTATAHKTDAAGLREAFTAYAPYPAWWMTAGPEEVVEASAAMRDLTRYSGWGITAAGKNKAG